MLCKCHWIVLYTVHFTAFCLGGRFSRTQCIHVLQGLQVARLSQMYTTAIQIWKLYYHLEVSPAVLAQRYKSVGSVS